MGEEWGEGSWGFEEYALMAGSSIDGLRRASPTTAAILH